MNNKDYTNAVDLEQYPEERLVSLDSPFINEKGSIQNLLNAAINGAAVIASKKGSVRSQHWHRSDWHFLYVLSGSMEYYERKVGAPTDPNYKPLIVKTGQMIFTPPNYVHKTIFLEDSILLSFSKRNRDHNSHEDDVVREEF